MKHLMALLLGLLMLGSGTAQAAQAALTKDLVILFTGNVHGAIEQGWGYAGIAAMRQHLEQQYHVLLVDTGDTVGEQDMGMVHDLEDAMTLMNTVGYDLAIPGRVELLHGVDRFLTLADSVADFDYICANITHDGQTAMKPYVLRSFDGVQVALLGITSPSLAQDEVMDDGAVTYDFAHDDTGAALYAAVQRAVDAARRDGADYVIALSYLGNAQDDSPWTAVEVISHTSGIDLLLDGRSYLMIDCAEEKNQNGQTVLRAACGDGLANLGYAVISADGWLETGMYEWFYEASFAEMMRSAGLVAAAVENVLAASDASAQE